ncbi:MAG TPA: GDSL-type esterase/lipase family protein [Actinocrinis sp.]|nr:GDSL-type esterase/lipase family protein [Actinocrinis sp.]
MYDNVAIPSSTCAGIGWRVVGGGVPLDRKGIASMLRRTGAFLPGRGLPGRLSSGLACLVAGSMAAALAVAVPVQASADARPAAAASLAALFNNTGISDDANPGGANLDGGGYGFSAEALAAVGWAPNLSVSLGDGASVQVPNVRPGSVDNVVADGQSFTLSGGGKALDFVVTSTDGNTSGSGTIAYTDGSTQAFTLASADWWSGTAGIVAGAGYRNGSGGAQVHQVNLYSDSVALTAGKTVASVTLPTVSATTVNTAALHVFAVAFAPTSGATGLSAFFNNVGISDNSNTAAANLDGSGHSLSAEDLAAAGWVPGASITLNATTLTWPNVPSGQADNVVADGQKVAVSGTGNALTFLLASTVGGTSGSGTITYTDGSTQSYSLSVGDWYSGPTDAMAIELPHWNGPSGTVAFPMKLYPDTVALNPAKSVASVTLPAISAAPGNGTAAMHVFALGVRLGSGNWAGTWADSIDDGIVSGPWTARTLRMVEHSSIGGSSARIRLDNAFGTAPVVIGHATIAVQSSGSSAAATPVTLTFEGNQSTIIPAGGQVMSDAVGFTLPADTNLLVSIYLPGPVQLASFHSLGQQDMYSTADQAGDQTADVSNYPVSNTFGFWTLLSGIDVLPSSAVGTVVALGDSITDGFNSTVDANTRWPNDLARRLLAQTQYPQSGVVDEGISANRVAADDFTGVSGTGTGGISAVSRADRDVFAQSGVRTVVILEGVNDAKSGITSAQIIAGLQQIAAEAHAHGIRVVVGTITPFQGYSAYTSAYEAVREAVNSFIRSNGGAFDAVVDFDAAMRDPNNQLALAPAYDSGDHLHPNDAGYQEMANTISLSQLS